MPPNLSIVTNFLDPVAPLAVGPNRSDPVWLAYLAVYTLAAVGCFAVIPQLDRIQDADTRHGLKWLLLTSGAWALSLVGVVVATDETVQYAFHVAGLVVGMATVGPWLYFCSAFTGRSLHRDRRIQAVAVGVFVAITVVKVTNPLHDIYFDAVPLQEPFPHLAIQPGILHWLAMGLAYSLAAVGYFMLFELFSKTDVDARPFVILVGLTGLPVVLDVVSLSSDALLAINYEPLGVAVFAVGVFALYTERLQAIQFAGGRSEPAIVLDDDGRVRDSNADARRRFPSLHEGVGEPFADVVPEVAAKLDAEDDILEVPEETGVRYYRVSENPFSTERAALGKLVVLDDVTHREQYRRELERQNERLEQFAGMVSHDLRNPLNVASLRLRSADADDEDIQAARAALERMESLIEDVLTLARQGQPIDEPEPVSLAATARSAWAMVQTGEAEFSDEGNVTVSADPERLQQLLENLFRNAVEHGSTSPRSSSTREDAVEHSSTSPASQARQDAVDDGGEDVTVTVGPLADADGFYVADDGPGIPEDEREAVFESGYTTHAAGSGFGLAIVQEIADAHRWDLSLTESAGGGARFEFRGVEVE